MSTNYDNILQTSWDDTPEPKLLPVGSWELVVRKMSIQPPKKEDGKAQVVVAFEAKEPMSDVPDSAIEELGSDWQKVVEPVFHRFWFESVSDKKRVRDFLDMLGVNTEGLTYEQSFKAAKDATIIGYLIHETFEGKAGTQTKNSVSHFQKVE